MTTATAQPWLEIPDFPEGAPDTELQAFFGIPPSPPDALDVNIRDKRKHWKKKEQKARTDDGLQQAAGVLQAIADAEDQLKRGAAATGGRTAQASDVDRTPISADEVSRELERLLFRGRYREALDRTQRYQEQWGAYPVFVDMRAVVILEAVQNLAAADVAPGLLESAIDGIRGVLDEMGPTEARYLTLVELLEAADRQTEIPAVFAEAEVRLETVSASFRARALQIRFRREPWTVLLRYCVELVRDAPDDRALRSELVDMILGRAVADLLPLKSPEEVREYQTVIAVAAWVADGVPVAEDAVRFHRMWASNADQPVFGGNWQWRAFFGLITLFIALPLLNGSMARPAWQVLLTGPSVEEQKKRKASVSSQNRAWFLVTNNEYIQPLHDKVKLPWQQRAGQWPAIDPSTLFNF